MSYDNSIGLDSCLRLETSILAFDLVQFFPSINHDVFLAVLACQGFPQQVVQFFESYLKGRKTQYSWDGDLSPLLATDIGLGQGSALSPIFSSLTMSPLMKEFQCRIGNATLISYVDNGTIIVQLPTWAGNLVKLKRAYKFIFESTEALGLVLKHSKSEVFHFSCKPGDDNLSIDLGFAPYTGNTPLKHRPIWCYLGFFFDCSLTFMEHTRWYCNNLALTTTQAMLMLGNSSHSLQPDYKQLLYRSCILPVATYGCRCKGSHCH